jgi:hypothetical protein
MTTKEKYELIDKTKINEKVLAILQNMEKSSSNFTDEAVNSKIDGALDKLIEGFRANKPEALRTLPEAKKEVKKEKEKATKENEGKGLLKAKKRLSTMEGDAHVGAYRANKFTGIKSDARAIAQEFGSAQNPAHPYLRTSMESQAPQTAKRLGEIIGRRITQYKAKQK